MVKRDSKKNLSIDEWKIRIQIAAVQYRNPVGVRWGSDLVSNKILGRHEKEMVKDGRLRWVKVLDYK